MKTLEGKNWKMYGDYQSYFQTEEEGVCEGLCYITLSRYPLDMSSKKYEYKIRSYHKDSGKVFYRRSGYSIMTRNTPIGDFRVAGIHTHFWSPCSGFQDQIEFYRQNEPQDTLIMGDFNFDFRRKPITKTDANKYDSCEGIPWDNLVAECSESPCLWDKSKYVGGDFIVRFAESRLIINKSWLVSQKDKRYERINSPDGHPIVFGIIGSTNLLIPSLEASPQEIAVTTDLNEDGKLDTADFASFVEYYKAGNTKIDYDKDGETERDIDDFTYFVRYYKAKTD